MKQLLLIAVGGAAGALGRYWLTAAVMALASRGSANSVPFPYGTLSVNIIGSFLMGLCYVLVVEKAVLPADLKPAVMVGFLGAFTTFSAFSLDAINLLESGQPFQAIIYVFTSVVVCIAAAAIAISLAKFTVGIF